MSHEYMTHTYYVDISTGLLIKFKLLHHKLNQKNIFFESKFISDIKHVENGYNKVKYFKI